MCDRCDGCDTDGCDHRIKRVIDVIARWMMDVREQKTDDHIHHYQKFLHCTFTTATPITDLKSKTKKFVDLSVKK